MPLIPSSTPLPITMLRIVSLASSWTLASLGVANPAGAQDAAERREGDIDVMATIPVDCKLDDASLATVIAEKLNAFLTAENAAGTLGIKKGPYEASVFPAPMLAYLRERGHVDMDVSSRERFKRGPRFQCVRELS